MARKTDIRLRRSAVAGSVPSENQLNLGELAINTADGALYFKKRDSSDNESIITAHDNNILHIDSTNARIGIGTLTPSSKLDVAGGIIASGDSAFGATAVTADGSKRTVHINDDTHGSALRLSQGSNGSLIRYDDTNGMQVGTVASKALKLETNDTTAVTIGTDQKVTLADELVLGNNQGIYLSGSDDGNTTTSSKLFRATGNATRLEYYNNSFVFDAKDNRAFELRNQNDTPIFKVTVAGELANFDGLGGAADTNIENSIVAVNNGDLSIVNGALNVGGVERINNAGDITGRDLIQARTDGFLAVFGDIKHRKDLQVMNSTSDGWTTWLDRNSGTPNLQNINNVTMAGVLSGPSTFYIDPAPADTVDDATVDTGTVVIVGDLRVSGTTTTINSTDISIADVNLTLAQGSTQASDANGAGITVDVGTNDPVITDPTFTYTSAIDSWNMNKDLRIATGGADATFMVGRDLTDEYIKIEVQDLNNVITASQDADADQPNPGDVSDHKFILNRTFAGTGESDFVVQKDGTDQLVIDKDGNVGIGTNNPAQKLHVAFSNDETAFSGGTAGAWGSDGIIINNTHATVGTMAMLQLRAGDADVHIANIRQGTDDGDLGFFFEGTEKVRFTNDGNVGIGTDDPGYKLEVAGDAFLSGNTNRSIFFGGTNTFVGEDSNSNVLKLRGGGSDSASTVYIDAGGDIGVGTSNPSAGLHIERRGDAPNYAGSAKIKLEGGSTAIELNRGTINQSQNIFFKTLDVEKWKLYQKTSNISSDTIHMYDSVGSSDLMTWKTGGYVGISNTDPIRKLDVAGTIGFKGLQGSGGVGGAVPDFTKHTWIENNTSDAGDTWHKVGTFTLPDNPYSGISLMVETVYPGSNHGGYDYNGYVWFNKVSVQRNGSTNGTVELDTGSVQGPESSKLRLHRNSVSEWELQIRSVIDNQSLYADITQLSSAGGASFDLQQSITAGSTGGTTITSPHVWGTTEDSALTHTFGQLQTSGRIISNGTIVANGVGTYDPDGDGLNLPDGDNTATDAAIAIPRGKRIVGAHDGYIRNIIGWMDDTHIDIGETNTALINRINLLPGHSGFVEILNSRDSVADNINDHAKLKIKDGWNSTQGSQTAWTAGQIVAGIELDSSDTSGNSGSDSAPRSTINLVSETTDASATALTFGTKGDVSGAPIERLRIDSTGNVGIGTSSPDFSLAVGNDSDSFNYVSIRASNTGNAGYLFSDADDADVGYVNYSHETNHMGLGTNGSERMRIDSSGRVGIGTTSPDSLLEVVGADPILTVRDTSTGFADSHATLRLAESGSGDTLNQYYDVALDAGQFTISDHTSERMRIDSSGNVGIGTDLPLDLLHINSDTTDARLLLDGHTNFDAELKFAENGSVKYTVGHDAATDSFRIGTTNVDTNPRLVIDSSGNVGIGTTSPSAILQVESYGIETTSTDTSAVTQVGITTFKKAEFRSAKFMVQATNTTDSTYMIAEILLIHDGTTPSITEYGIIFTGSAREATFDADISGDDVRLLATPGSTDDITFRVVSHQILV